MRIGKSAFLLAISANVFIPAARAAVYRVSPDAADSSSGASWSEATTLSDALSRAKSGDEVWLKSGQYTFSTTLGVGAVVSTDAKIRGGFAGTESSASERTFSDSTVLKGAVTNLLINAPSGLVEIDHITGFKVGIKHVLALFKQRYSALFNAIAYSRFNPKVIILPF